MCVSSPQKNPRGNQPAARTYPTSRPGLSDQIHLLQSLQRWRRRIPPPVWPVFNLFETVGKWGGPKVSRQGCYFCFSPFCSLEATNLLPGFHRIWSPPRSYRLRCQTKAPRQLRLKVLKITPRSSVAENNCLRYVPKIW